MTEQFAIVILLVTLGYFLRHINFIKAADSQIIATLVPNIAFPSLVIVNLNSAELKLSFSILPVLTIIYGIMAKMIAVWFSRRYGNHMRGSVGMMTGVMNIGLFAYPLIEVIWSKTGLIHFAMADIGGAFVMFETTYFVGSHSNEGSDQFDFKYLGKKLLQSVPLATYIVMLILNISHIHLPHMAVGFFGILSYANMPLLMILLGVMLNFTPERKCTPTTTKYLCLHYGLTLVAGLLVYTLSPILDDMIKTTLLVAWMFPVGVAIIPYGIWLKHRTLTLIGMAISSTIIISIIILYACQAVFV